MRNMQLLVMGVFVMACPGIVLAEVLAYETFRLTDYSVGQSLVGTTVPGEGFQGEWQYVNGTSGNEEILLDSLVVAGQQPSVNAGRQRRPPSQAG